MNQEPIIVERVLNAPAERIWKALTDKDQMKQWYFDLKEFKPEVGFEFRFEGGPPEKVYLHICVITEVIPQQRLSHSWRYDGYPGNSFVTWELMTEGDQTRVTLKHEGLETFPQVLPDFAKANFEAGWTDIVGRSLKSFVEGN